LPARAASKSTSRATRTDGKPRCQVNDIQGGLPTSGCKTRWLLSKVARPGRRTRKPCELHEQEQLESAFCKLNEARTVFGKLAPGPRFSHVA
jgi:hypothetical protein